MEQIKQQNNIPAIKVYNKNRTIRKVLAVALWLLVIVVGFVLFTCAYIYNVQLQGEGIVIFFVGIIGFIFFVVRKPIGLKYKIRK